MGKLYIYIYKYAETKKRRRTGTYAIRTLLFITLLSMSMGGLVADIRLADSGTVGEKGREVLVQQ